MKVSHALDDHGLSRAAMRAELLDAETELGLARAWRDERDVAALHRLVTAYMRLAISMATKFRRYGAPMGDLIQEASLGLLKAAEKFDPDRGVRFSTYAVWWIKASIQDHVMRNWSLVRTGSTTSQKSLFFNLKRVQAKFEREAEASGTPLDSEQLKQKIAQEIGVAIADVEMMQGRLGGGDFSLNAPQGSDDDEGREWIDTLADEDAPAETRVQAMRDVGTLRGWLLEALRELPERQQFILRERKLRDSPRTLDSLGRELGLSKERVRQLEAAALTQMRKSLERHGEAVYDLMA
ncbi:RNA polymerase factor sigma-32 [Tropicimonas sp. IMCC6043]|uniref:RNA polymerase factor sigma-32 n=1 Tax=Tropicimonas sp. IMCC6043 TaxID=2510645 RepID=UPI00101CBE0D|nr:RNA polymerase factor sigma-32 [Tropicimonas sp. IMCC6043]RYH08320.1 RNA polymerase factor sigma-32 [Tropicimonas sp. IMCC6043]